MVHTDDVFGALAQFGFVVYDSFGIHTHACSLTGRLYEERETQFRPQGLVAEGKFLEWGNGQVAVTPEALRQSLVQ